MGDHRAVRLAAARLRRPAYAKVVYPAPVGPSHVPDENPTSDHRVSFRIPEDWRGMAAVLAVRVHQWSTRSYLEDQDMWWLSGFRSGTLLARPPGPREWSAESYVHPPRRIEAELTRPVRRAGR